MDSIEWTDCVLLPAFLNCSFLDYSVRSVQSVKGSCEKMYMRRYVIPCTRVDSGLIRLRYGVLTRNFILKASVGA